MNAKFLEAIAQPLQISWHFGERRLKIDKLPVQRNPVQVSPQAFQQPIQWPPCFWPNGLGLLLEIMHVHVYGVRAGL